MPKFTATDANRRFSELLALVRKGKTAEITVRGEVVAKLIPVAKADSAADARQQKQWDAFMKRLRDQPTLNLPRVRRDELYD
jgi:prevent-host-death family protein